MGICQELIVHAAAKASGGSRLDLSIPRYDQDTFIGRYRHFFKICNPVQLLKTKEEIVRAREIVYGFIKGKKYPELTDDQIWNLKYILYASVHPKTNQPIPLFARMAAQCPMNAIIIGTMLTFYKTKKEVIFCQWLNQSFNALVNKANSSDPSAELADHFKSYAVAVTMAVTVAVGLNHVTAKFSPFVQRLAPFMSTSILNSINLPLSRQSELKQGISLYKGDEMSATEVAKSKTLAIKAIAATVFSRIVMAVPHMTLIPIIMTKYEPFFTKNPKWIIPFQFSTCALLLLFSTPLGLAMFPQHVHLPVDQLDSAAQETIKKMKNPPKIVFYNKGL